MPVECCVALSAPLRKEAFAEGDSVALASYRSSRDALAGIVIAGGSRPAGRAGGGGQPAAAGARIPVPLAAAAVPCLLGGAGAVRR
eukprot:COSAG01_NODE_5319_length_4335_cov_48.955619_1_plen_86_part_00